MYFDSFGTEYNPQEALSKIKYKSIDHNIFGIQSDGSIICGFYCTAFTEYMLVGKTLLNYANSFSPNDYQKNGKIIYMCLKEKYGKKECKP